MATSAPLQAARGHGGVTNREPGVGIEGYAVPSAAVTTRPRLSTRARHAPDAHAPLRVRGRYRAPREPESHRLGHGRDLDLDAIRPAVLAMRLDGHEDVRILPREVRDHAYDDDLPSEVVGSPTVMRNSRRRRERGHGRNDVRELSQHFPPYGSIAVMFLFGTWPTGIRVTSRSPTMSMTDTSFEPAFAT